MITGDVQVLHETNYSYERCVSVLSDMIERDSINLSTTGIPKWTEQEVKIFRTSLENMGFRNFERVAEELNKETSEVVSFYYRDWKLNKIYKDFSRNMKRQTQNDTCYKCKKYGDIVMFCEASSCGKGWYSVIYSV